MDAVVKKKWVEALRSGEYKQCKRALYQPALFLKDSYCCLGVVLKVVDPESRPYDYSLLHKPKIDMTGAQVELCMSLNDEDGYSFKQIADVIEKEF